MTYCTVNDVKATINFPNDNAPVSDTIIEGFILNAEEEIEELYTTKFGSVEASGTADGDYTTTTFSDSNQAFENDQYANYVLWIYSGTGTGQYSEIQSNTATTLTFNAVTTEPDNTSLYKILKLGYRDETVDGSGTTEQFVQYQPLINLNELTIDSTTVTPSLVYTTKYSGLLQLGKPNVEVSNFSNKNQQLVNIKYIYGIYPLPNPIKRLATVLASIRTLTAQIAGTYDDFTTVSLPGGFSGSKGEPYMNIKAALDYLQGEARGIIYGTQSTGQVSGDFRTIATYRPFAVFG